MIKERLILAYLAVSIFFLAKNLSKIYGKNSLQKVDNFLEKEEMTDIKVVFNLQTIRTIITCCLIIFFILTPLVEIKDYLFPKTKKEVK